MAESFYFDPLRSNVKNVNPVKPVNHTLIGQPYSNVPLRPTIPKGNEIANIGMRGLQASGGLQTNTTEPFRSMRQPASARGIPVGDSFTRPQGTNLVTTQQQAKAARPATQTFANSLDKANYEKYAARTKAGATAGTPKAAHVNNTIRNLAQGPLPKSPLFGGSNVGLIGLGLADAAINNPLVQGQLQDVADRNNLNPNLVFGLDTGGFDDSPVGKAVGGATDYLGGLHQSAVDYTSNTLLPAIYDNNEQAEAAMANTVTTKETPAAVIGKPKHNLSFDSDDDFNAFIDSEYNKRNTGQLAPTPVSSSIQKPKADMALSQAFDSQQPQIGLGGQLGGYSPAGIQEAATYRAQRDLGDNQTQMSPTDFGQYGEGIGGNTLEWDMNDTVAAMSPEQRQQFRAASEYQQIGMAPELPSNIEQGQQALGLSQQKLSHDIAQSKKQKPIEYGMADGVTYPKSGAEGKAFMEKRQKQRQRLINVMSDPKQSKEDVSRAQIIFNNTFGGL